MTSRIMSTSPCNTCTKRKYKDRCTGCPAWHEWFAEAWKTVCERIRVPK